MVGTIPSKAESLKFYTKKNPVQFELGPVYLDASFDVLHANISKTVICLETPAKILQNSASLPANKFF